MAIRGALAMVANRVRSAHAGVDFRITNFYSSRRQQQLRGWGPGNRSNPLPERISQYHLSTSATRDKGTEPLTMVQGILCVLVCTAHATVSTAGATGGRQADAFPH